MFTMNAIKFIPLTFSKSNIKTYVKIDIITQLTEIEDETWVCTINDTTPMIVKESVGEILAKMGATVWNAKG